MPIDDKHTMSELIDLIEKVAKDENYKKDQKALMEIVYLISNHVQLMSEIKKAREYLQKQREVAAAKNQSQSAYPKVTDVMKG